MLSGLLFTTLTYADSYVYDAMGKRDPFVPLGSEMKKEVVPILDDITIEGIALEGIVWDEKEPVAIINSTLVTRGQSIGSFILQRIESDKIVLRRGDEEHIIHLIEE